MNRLVLLSLVLAAGCDSLVDGNCRNGYDRTGTQCLAHANEQPDADVDGGFVNPPDVGDVDASTPSPDAPIIVVDAGPDANSVDAPPDALTCAAPLEACMGSCVDLQTNPDHCGSCTHTCPSGICTAGHCEGEAWGHIVAIGHDYTSYHASQRRVLANAVSLGASDDVAVAWWPGESRSMAHLNALSTGMSLIGRQWHAVSFPSTPITSFQGIDVVLVAPEHGDGNSVEAQAAQWATAFDEFLRDGGVIVVLDGENGQNHRFAHGAGLFDVGAPVTVTGQPAAIVDATDAVAQNVVAPYLAETQSVAWTGAPDPVVTTMGGTQTVVFHSLR